MTRRKEVEALVDRYLDLDTPTEGLPLAVPPFGRDEVVEAIDTLLSGWLTMGNKCAAFERAWADAVGTKHAVCVNSGSSALLVLLSALVETGALERKPQSLGHSST